MLQEVHLFHFTVAQRHVQPFLQKVNKHVRRGLLWTDLHRIPSADGTHLGFPASPKGIFSDSVPHTHLRQANRPFDLLVSMFGHGPKSFWAPVGATEHTVYPF